MTGHFEIPTIRLWSLTDDVLVETGADDGTLVVATKWGEVTLSGADAVVRESLRRMGLGPISLRNIAGDDVPVRGDSANDLARILDSLGSSVVHSLGLLDGHGPLLSAVPLVRNPSFELASVPVVTPVRLSRFATMRPREDALVLEVPGAEFAVILDQQPTPQVVSFLAKPFSSVGIARVSGIAQHVVADIISYLAAAGVVLVGDEKDDAEGLDGWSHHELLFHQRNRSRHRDALPDMAPSRRIDPSPVVKAVPPGRRFPLYRPPVSDLAAIDTSLTDLLETDHGCPAISLTEIPAERLGELLFRAARIRSLGPARLGAHNTHGASQRPYFSIACFYELDLYLSLNRCTGLPKGIYHYDPLEHSLTLINDAERDLSEMLDAAKLAAASIRQPSATVTVTARPGRVAWALWGSTYSTALSDLGAFQQTLYLTAKAMGMSAHAVPVGGDDVVERVLGLSWPAEVGVGECVLDG